MSVSISFDGQLPGNSLCESAEIISQASSKFKRNLCQDSGQSSHRAQHPVKGGFECLTHLAEQIWPGAVEKRVETSVARGSKTHFKSFIQLPGADSRQ